MVVRQDARSYAVMKRQERDLEHWLAANAREQPLAVILGTSWNALSFARSLGRRRVPVLLLEQPSAGATLGATPAMERCSPSLPSTTIQRRGSGPCGSWATASPIPGCSCPRGMPIPCSSRGMSSCSGRAFVSWFRRARPWSRSSTSDCSMRSHKKRAYRFRGPTSRSRPSRCESSRPSCASPACSSRTSPTPAAGRWGRRCCVARSIGELVSGYERLAARDVAAMVQEIVAGEDRALFGYLAVWDSDGRELAWLTKRKLRQSPPGFGDGSLQVTVEAPEVAELSRRLLRAFDYRGFVGVEFKLDATSGSYHLMEINSRTGSGNQMAISAGVDFPWIGYRYLTGSDRWRRAHPGLPAGSQVPQRGARRRGLPRAPEIRRDDHRPMGAVDPRNDIEGHLGPGRSASVRGPDVATRQARHQ